MQMCGHQLGDCPRCVYFEVCFYFSNQPLSKFGTGILWQQPLPYQVYQPLPWKVQSVSRVDKDRGFQRSSSVNSSKGHSTRVSVHIDHSEEPSLERAAVTIQKQ
ncbi:uncharacterized protein [Narcine bancroftii]|uniref:uncharacterized protein isoform X2 n=1 Tax=Narcine bancroftii TaxID=1343680 RepID=UPI003831F4E0